MAVRPPRILKKGGTVDMSREIKGSQSTELPPMPSQEPKIAPESGFSGPQTKLPTSEIKALKTPPVASQSTSPKTPKVTGFDALDKFLIDTSDTWLPALAKAGKAIQGTPLETFEKIGKGFQIPIEAATQFGSFVTGAADFGADVMSEYYGIDRKDDAFFKTLNEFMGDVTASQAYELSDEFQGTMQKDGAWEAIKERPMEAVRFGIAPVLASGIAALNPVTLTALYGSIANEIKDEAQAHGMSKGKSLALGAGAAIPMVIAERLGAKAWSNPAIANKMIAVVGRYTPKMAEDVSEKFFPQLVKNAAKAGIRIGTGAAGEGVTEMTQEAVQKLAYQTFREVSPKEWIDSLTLAGFIGMVGGGLFGGTSEVFNTAKEIGDHYAAVSKEGPTPPPSGMIKEALDSLMGEMARGALAPQLVTPEGMRMSPSFDLLERDASQDTPEPSPQDSQTPQEETQDTEQQTTQEPIQEPTETRQEDPVDDIPTPPEPTSDVVESVFPDRNQSRYTEPAQGILNKMFPPQETTTAPPFGSESQGRRQEAPTTQAPRTSLQETVPVFEGKELATVEFENMKRAQQEGTLQDNYTVEVRRVPEPKTGTGIDGFAYQASIKDKDGSTVVQTYIPKADLSAVRTMESFVAPLQGVEQVERVSQYGNPYTGIAFRYDPSQIQSAQRARAVPHPRDRKDGLSLAQALTGTKSPIAEITADPTQVAQQEDIPTPTDPTTDTLTDPPTQAVDPAEAQDIAPVEISQEDSIDDIPAPPEPQEDVVFDEFGEQMPDFIQEKMDIPDPQRHVQEREEALEELVRIKGRENISTNDDKPLLTPGIAYTYQDLKEQALYYFQPEGSHEFSSQEQILFSDAYESGLKIEPEKIVANTIDEVLTGFQGKIPVLSTPIVDGDGAAFDPLVEYTRIKGELQAQGQQFAESIEPPRRSLPKMAFKFLNQYMSRAGQFTSGVIQERPENVPVIDNLSGASNYNTARMGRHITYDMIRMLNEEAISMIPKDTPYEAAVGKVQAINEWNIGGEGVVPVNKAHIPGMDITMFNAQQWTDFLNDIGHLPYTPQIFSPMDVIDIASRIPVYDKGTDSYVTFQDVLSRFPLNWGYGAGTEKGVLTALTDGISKDVVLSGNILIGTTGSRDGSVNAVTKLLDSHRGLLTGDNPVTSYVVIDSDATSDATVSDAYGYRIQDLKQMPSYAFLQALAKQAQKAQLHPESKLVIYYSPNVTYEKIAGPLLSKTVESDASSGLFMERIQEALGDKVEFRSTENGVIAPPSRVFANATENDPFIDRMRSYSVTRIAGAPVVETQGREVAMSERLETGEVPRAVDPNQEVSQRLDQSFEDQMLDWLEGSPAAAQRAKDYTDDITEVSETVYTSEDNQNAQQLIKDQGFENRDEAYEALEVILGYQQLFDSGQETQLLRTMLEGASRNAERVYIEAENALTEAQVNGVDQAVINELTQQRDRAKDQYEFENISLSNPSSTTKQLQAKYDAIVSGQPFGMGEARTLKNALSAIAEVNWFMSAKPNQETGIISLPRGMGIKKEGDTYLAGQLASNKSIIIKGTAFKSLDKAKQHIQEQLFGREDLEKKREDAFIAVKDADINLVEKALREIQYSTEGVTETRTSQESREMRAAASVGGVIQGLKGLKNKSAESINFDDFKELRGFLQGYTSYEDVQTAIDTTRQKEIDLIERSVAALQQPKTSLMSRIKKNLTWDDVAEIRVREGYQAMEAMHTDIRARLMTQSGRVAAMRDLYAANQGTQFASLTKDDIKNQLKKLRDNDQAAFSMLTDQEIESMVEQGYEAIEGDDFSDTDVSLRNLLTRE